MTETINYMQVLPEWHCFRCHKDFDNRQIDTVKHALECKLELKPCTRDCGKWFKPVQNINNFPQDPGDDDNVCISCQ